MDNLQTQPTKPLLQSLTVRGSIIGAIPAIYAVCHAFGLTIPDGSLESIANGIAAGMMVASVVMTFIGRIRATHKVV